MPTTNRDRETLFSQKKLHLWFAVSSFLLLVSCMGAIWQDYDRAWKDYQRDALDKRLEVARARLEEAEEALDAPEREAELTAAEDAVEIEVEALGDDDDLALLREKLGEPAWAEHRERIQDAIRRNEAGVGDRLREAERELREIEPLVEAADAEVRRIKGLLDPAIYELDQARADRNAGLAGQEAVEEARAEVNRLARVRYQAEIDLSRLKSRRESLREEVRELQEPMRLALERKDEIENEQEKARAMVRGLELKLEENPWRNWPILDFIDPSLEIQQVVLKDIHDNWNFATNVKVDRCMTCHINTDQPDFADPEIVLAHDVDPWMQAHPALELIAGAASPHAKDAMGCTVCHHGVGWSTDFSRAAHRPTSPEQRAEWVQEHDWTLTPYIDFPMLPTEYVQGQCFKCHKAGLYVPPPYVEHLDHGWTQQVRDVREPRDEETNPVVPAFENYGDQRLPPAPPPTDGNLLAVAEATEEFLRNELAEHYETLVRRSEKHPDDLTQQYDVNDHGWWPEGYFRGYDTIVTYGCMGCHKLADFGEEVGYDTPPRVGPNLDYIADKVTPEFLERWIRVPEMFRIDTKMPAFYYFVHKDHDWHPIPGGDGEPQVLPVLDSHRIDAGLTEDIEHAMGEVSNVDRRALARMDVEILAQKTYLLAASGSRADPQDAGYDAAYASEPPPGDPERGREAVFSYGCVACHIVPEVKDGDTWVPDDGARFGGDPLAMPGPRLQGLGSKLKDRIWLDAWLANPRHYTQHTAMPDMRWRPEKDENGNIVRSAEQVRADVIDYLLSFRNEAFEALPSVESRWTTDHDEILSVMYEEFFPTRGGRTLPKSEVVGRAEGEPLADRLASVGERLMARNGCFGCHVVAGHEADQPIGTELSKWGVKDLHQLDFGRIDHHVVDHTRHDFARHKITFPRMWDLGKQKRWTDTLKMPRFNFRMDDPWAPGAPVGDTPSTRAAVVAFVLGFVDEPIKNGAIFQPDEAQRDILDGRRVVQRYSCNNCHTIEGRMGLYWRYMVFDNNTVGDNAMASAPPNLFAQGHRVQPDWLIKFLKEPFDLRPLAIPRMPRFELSDAEARALTNYFGRLAGREGRLAWQPDSALEGHWYDEPVTIETDAGTHEVRGLVEEAELLFNTVNCNKCHLPKGSPGADPTEGGVAPGLDLAQERLQWDWTRWLLNDPNHVINGTKMVAFWPAKRRYGRVVNEQYAPFLLDLREDEEFMRLWTSEDKAEQNRAETMLAQRQMDAVVDYLLHHYRHPYPLDAPPEAPR